GLGLLGSLVALAFLIDTPTRNLAIELSGVIYGLTLVTSYAATTIYHAAQCRVRKARWRVLDHCAVYALIAGSYTPLAVAGLGGELGLLVLLSVWLLAGLGIAFKLRYRFRFPGTSVAIYLVMGWIGVLMVGRIMDAVGPGAVSLMVMGGLCYTLGTVFFGAKRVPYHHAVWHVLVIVGSAFYYKAIVDHVLIVGG
ncbi:MAG: hemolysin III family protein, partial [Gemmatimonadetes bacterium]|nr:hemolysin III family protein [Gemmatimonadota bacterium]